MNTRKDIKLAALKNKKRSVIKVGDVEVGKDLIIIAGPCSVESEEQMLVTAEKVKNVQLSFPQSIKQALFLRC